MQFIEKMHLLNLDFGSLLEKLYVRQKYLHENTWRGVTYIGRIANQHKYRIVLNKCSLHRGRHPGEAREPRGTTQRFSSHFCSLFSYFHLFWGSNQSNLGRGLSERAEGASIQAGAFIQHYTVNMVLLPKSSLPPKQEIRSKAIWLLLTPWVVTRL